MAGLQERKQRRFRIGRLAIVTLITIVVGAGGYALYFHQRGRNTMQLHRDAERFVAESQWSKAAVAYRYYLHRKPDDCDALAAYADVLIQRLEKTPEVLSDTIRVLRRLVKIDPDNVDAVSKLTDLYISFREFFLAEGLAERWVQLAPESADAFLALSLAYHGLGKPEKAAATLAGFLRRRPSAASLYPPLIQLLAREFDKPDEAMEWLNKALHTVPDAYEVHLAAFDLYGSRKEMETAAKHIRRAVDLAPDSMPVLIAAALFHISRDQLDRAGDLLKTAEGLAPENRGILLARSTWAIERDNPADLIGAAGKLMQHARDEELELIVLAADLFVRANQPESADRCLGKLTNLPDENTQLRGWVSALKGIRALMSGRPFTAIPHLETALREQPASSRVMQKLAQAFLELKSADMAAAMYRRAIVLSQDATGARLALAKIELDRGEPELARLTVDAISTTRPDEMFQAEVIKAVADVLSASKAELPAAELSRRQGVLDELADKPPAKVASVELLADCLILSGRRRRAMDLLRHYAVSSKEGANLGTKLGNLLLESEDYQEAGALARQLIDTHPELLAGHELRIRIMSATDGLSAAHAYVRNSALGGTVAGRLWETLADLYAEADQIQTALQALRTAVSLMPGDIAVRQKLARLTPQLGEALALIEEMRDIEGDAGLHWRYDRAWALMRIGETDNAAEVAAGLLEECLIARPNWVSVRLLLGDAQCKLGRPQRAADSYRSAMAHRPDLATGSAAFRLVHVLKQMDRFAEADRVLNTLADAHPDAPEILRLKTEQYYRTRNLIAAAASAKRLLDINPDDPAWAALTADLHRRTGDLVTAERIARQALENNAYATPLLWSLAQVLIKQGHPDEALTLVRDAAQNRGGGTHLVLYARILAQLDRHENARSVLDQAVQADPENPNVWAGAGDVWMALGNRAKQIECARKAIHLHGDDPAESVALARLLAQGDGNVDRREAAEIVRRRLANSPDDPDVLILEGRLATLAQPPDWAAAERSLSRALAIDPRNPRAHELLAIVEFRQGRLSAARNTASAGLVFFPHDPDLLLASAEIYSARGEYERAIPPLLHLLDIKPRSPEALELLVSACAKTGQVDRVIGFIEDRAPELLRTPGETVIMAKLYEVKQDHETAFAMFRSAAANDKDSPNSHREYLHCLARRKAFDEVHEVALTRARTHPDDIESLMLAAHILGSKAADAELRDVGLRWLEAVAQGQPEYASDALYRSALCHYARGEFGLAENRFLEAHRLSPHRANIVNDLAWLYAENLHRSAEAASLIDQFLASGGTADAHMLDTHGVAFMRLGRYDTARQKLTACLRVAGETPTRTAVTLHLGRLMLETGRTREGRSYIREALHLHEQRGGLTTLETEEAREILESAAALSETG